MVDEGGCRRFRLPLASWQEAVPLALILTVGAALRFYGLEWDDGQWLHPDERQIYFVVLRLGWPASLAEALSPASPLNPGFFAYGSLPIYLLALVNAVLRPLWPALRYPENLHLAGRTLAILCDLGSVYLTYRLARTVLSQVWNGAGEPGGRGGPASETGRALALLAAAFVSLAVLHVQIAHFYTADTLLTFLVLLCLNMAAGVAVGGGRGRQIALGIAFGLALATKVSALPAVFVLFVAFHSRPDTKRPWAALGRMVLPLLVALAVFVVSQPYALIDGPTFVEDTVRESQIARGSLDVPYTVQYAGTLPFLYSAWQTALWGLALPLGLVGWLGFAATFLRWLRRGPWRDALLLAWAGPYLVITGLLYAKHLRYMLPLVPVLCIMAVGLLAYPMRSRPADRRPRGGEEHPSSMAIRVSSLVSVFLLLAAVAYALVFSGIYRLPHSWILASEWIYRNVPAGSTLAVEHWDTALPLAVVVDGVPASPTQYTYQTLPLYDEPDDAAKWKELAASLSESDVLILASRRLYGSIPRQSERYPVASRYYDLLFAGELGFELVGEFTRGPDWLNPRVPPLPGSGPALLRPDESFVVYDHPRALILRNVERLTAEELLRRLGVAQGGAGGGYHPGTGRDRGRGGGSAHTAVACGWATVARSVVKTGLLGVLDEGTLARTEEQGALHPHGCNAPEGTWSGCALGATAHTERSTHLQCADSQHTG